jgi:hypothetical protein
MKAEGDCLGRRKRPRREGIREGNEVNMIKVYYMYV